jgi:hypothetical protein
MMMPMIVVAVVAVLVMSVSVTVAMAVIMVFPAPGALPVVPPVGSMFVAGAGPICTGVGRPYVVTGDPAIVLALGRPETAHPDESRSRRRWRGLDAYGRRRNSDIYGNLRPGGRCESCCENSESDTLFEHAALSLRIRNSA